MIDTQLIPFDKILPIWKEKLWPNRLSPIETHSAMTWPYDGNPLTHDMDIFNYNPTFFGVYNDDKLIGVNSGHRTRKNSYRSRGIWVDPEYRSQGIAQKLFEMTEHQARQEGCDMIWSIPRKSALSAYTNFGFETVGKFFDEGMEFGPNIYVIKILNSNYEGLL